MMQMSRFAGIVDVFLDILKKNKYSFEQVDKFFKFIRVRLSNIFSDDIFGVDLIDIIRLYMIDFLVGILQFVDDFLRFFDLAII